MLFDISQGAAHSGILPWDFLRNGAGPGSPQNLSQKSQHPAFPGKKFPGGGIGGQCQGSHGSFVHFGAGFSGKQRWQTVQNIRTGNAGGGVKRYKQGAVDPYTLHLHAGMAQEQRAWHRLQRDALGQDISAAGIDNILYLIVFHHPAAITFPAVGVGDGTRVMPPVKHGGQAL